MIETVYEGVELSTEFLDDLWIAITVKVPAGVWVPITKDHERVTAGLKYIIDCKCYGETEFDVVFNQEYTHFRKNAYPKKKPNIFEGMYLTNHPAAYWTEQDRLKLERDKREYEKAQRADRRKEQAENIRPKRRRK